MVVARHCQYIYPLLESDASSTNLSSYSVPSYLIARHRDRLFPAQVTGVPQPERNSSAEGMCRPAEMLDPLL